MSDNKTPIPSSSKNSSAAKNSSVLTPAATSSSNKLTYAIALIFVLLLAIAVGFFQYRMEALTGQNKVLEHQISQLDQQSRSSLEKSIKLELELKKVDAMNAQLDFMQQTLNQIPGAKMNDWKLAEVEYLLRLANQRANLQHELSGAWALFDAANKILASLDDPGLLKVREKIAQEMLLLGQENQLDRQGLYTQIQAIKSLIHQQIQPPATFKNDPANDLASDLVSNSAHDESESADLWEKIASLVHIRYSDDAFDAPLDAQQYQILEHSLLLMLEQTQWALLKADKALYQSSLDNAINWINKKLRHKEALNLSNALTQLKNIDVQLNIPDVSASLSLLRQTLNDRTYRPTAPVDNKGSKLNTNSNKVSTATVEPTL